MQLNNDNKILYERLKRAIIKNKGGKKKKKKKMNFDKYKKMFKFAKVFSTIAAIGLNLFEHVKKLMKKLSKD